MCAFLLSLILSLVCVYVPACISSLLPSILLPNENNPSLSVFLMLFICTACSCTCSGSSMAACGWCGGSGGGWETVGRGGGGREGLLPAILPIIFYSLPLSVYLPTPSHVCLSLAFPLYLVLVYVTCFAVEKEKRLGCVCGVVVKNDMILSIVLIILHSLFYFYFAFYLWLFACLTCAGFFGAVISVNLSDRTNNQFGLCRACLPSLCPCALCLYAA